MIRFFTRPIPMGLLLTVLAMTLMACSGPTGKTPPGPTPEEKAQQQAQLLSQRLSNLQVQAAQLNQKLEVYRAEQEQRAKALINQSQELNAQIVALQTELSATGAPVPAGKTVQSAPSQPAPATQIQTVAPTIAAQAPVASVEQKPAVRPLLRLILLIILLAAVAIIVKIFMGRWGEDEDEEDELGPESADDEISTPEGTIRISPEARTSPRGETASADAGDRDDKGIESKS